jgi:hypothetical protein
LLILPKDVRMEAHLQASDLASFFSGCDKALLAVIVRYGFQWAQTLEFEKAQIFAARPTQNFTREFKVGQGAGPSARFVA